MSLIKVEKGINSKWDAFSACLSTHSTLLYAKELSLFGNISLCSLFCIFQICKWLLTVSCLLKFSISITTISISSNFHRKFRKVLRICFSIAIQNSYLGHRTCPLPISFRHVSFIILRINWREGMRKVIYCTY